MQRFKRLILAIILVLSLLVSTKQVTAESAVEVSTYEEYRDALKDPEVTYIKIIANLEYGDRGFEIKSNDGLKSIDLNGYKITTNWLDYYLIYDDIKMIFQDSSPAQTGLYYATEQGLFIFEGHGSNDKKLTVEFLSGSYIDDHWWSNLIWFINKDTSSIFDVNVIVRNGVFAGSGSLFRFSLGDGEFTVELEELVYKKYDYDKVGLLPDDYPYEDPFLTTLDEFIDSSKYEMYVDGVKVTDYSTLVNAEQNKGDLIEIKEKSKEELIISGLTDNESLVYNGSPQAPSGTLVVEDDKVPVSELEVLYEGTGSTTYSSTAAPTIVGDYKVTYKISDDNPNYFGSVTYNFKIVKATPVYTLPTGLISGVNKPLNSVALPDGFSWNNPDTIMDNVGSHRFKAIFTPTDTHNYLVVTGLDIEVRVGATLPNTGINNILIYIYFMALFIIILGAWLVKKSNIKEI